MGTAPLTAFWRYSIPRVTFSFAFGSLNSPGAITFHRFTVRLRSELARLKHTFNQRAKSVGQIVSWRTANVDLGPLLGFRAGHQVAEEGDGFVDRVGLNEDHIADLDVTEDTVDCIRPA